MSRPKPNHGQPCNRCGECCRNNICPVGAAVLGLPRPDRHAISGTPCPILEALPDGATTCGLVAHPEQFRPVQTAFYGAAAMRAAALELIGVNGSCDALRAGEPFDPAVSARNKAWVASRPVEARISRKLWGFA